MNNKKNLKKEIILIQSLFVSFFIILTYLLITQNIEHSKTNFVLIFILSFFVLLLSSNLIYKMILKNLDKPLEALKDGFNQLTHGNLSFRIIESNIDDKHVLLMKNFNEMAKSHELSIKIIEKNQRDLENIISRRTISLNETNTKLQDAMEKLKKSQLSRLQTEKQKSLSAIVSGFAHEINNPLAGILGHLDLIALKNDIPDYAREKHLSIRKQAVRIKSIVKELNLLNPDSEQIKLSINLMNFFEKFIKVFIKTNMFINIEFKNSSIFKNLIIIGNHFSLWLVFEGICKNSVEAIKGNNIINGEIKITLNESKDKKYAIINVNDNGGGFENIDNVFDPFYTTKSRTKKKGIGLSIAYNMINEHNGSIEVSNNDKGATVTIKLPLSPT